MERVTTIAERMELLLRQASDTQTRKPLQYECEACSDSGWVQIDRGMTRCACQRERVIRRELPARYHEASLAMLPTRLQERVLGWLSKSGDGMLIPGPPGCGKTFLAAAIEDLDADTTTQFTASKQ